MPLDDHLPDAPFSKRMIRTMPDMMPSKTTRRHRKTALVANPDDWQTSMRFS
jgi:hypothetical protein